ncbi:MAG: transcription antitermination factor NusB [Kiritimatiellia bacterium]|jgi:N utilization substance protein B
MSSGRHESRMWAVQFLFQRDFNQGDVVEDLQQFWNERKTGPALRQFTEELIHGVEAKRKDIDALIQKYAQHWNVARMGAVDRNVMRVAVYEMLERTDIPPVVSINEAVELAKELSGEDSGKFVNGILDHIAKEIGRPVRTVRPVNLPAA